MVEAAVRKHYATQVEMLVLTVLDVSSPSPETVAGLRKAMLSAYEPEIREAIARAARLVEKAGLA